MLIIVTNILQKLKRSGSITNYFLKRKNYGKKLSSNKKLVTFQPFGMKTAMKFR
jgi:hypothetical protein